MPLKFLISATNPGAGKTMVGCALAFAFKVRAMRVGVMKPVETGCAERGGELIAEDGASLRAAASSDDPLELITLYRYRSALAPAAAAAIDGAAAPERAHIVGAYHQIAAHSDVVIVEEAGGLGAQINWGWNYADLACDLGLELVLVVADRPGFIGAAAITIDYAARRGIPVRGCILNSRERDAADSAGRNAEFLSRTTGVPCLGAIRFKEPLALNIVERLL
ncbi:MAG: dethiobiotin synthase [Candidatus Binataceae bacterium]